MEHHNKHLTLDSVQRSKEVLDMMKEIPELEDTEINFLKGFPSMLTQNGLGQTMAFLFMKKKEYVYNILVNLLFKEDLEKRKKRIKPINPSDVMDIILSMEVNEYIQKQSYAIDYAGWIKMFALAKQKPATNTADKKRETDAKEK